MGGTPSRVGGHGHHAARDLIDGEKIWERVERKGMGLRQTTILDGAWFDRFD